MSIPKYDQTFLPILKVLSDGSVVKRNELSKKLLEKGYFTLTTEEMSQKTSVGDLLFNNRVNWGLVYLKQAKLIQQPSRGLLQITPKGMGWLNNHQESLTLSGLRADADFRAHEPAKRIGIVEVEHETKDLSPHDLISQGYDEISKSLKKDLIEKLHEIDPYYFQKVVLMLFQKMGYGDFIETPKSGDGGVDGIINRDQLGLERIYMQAKRYGENNKVREPEIRNFIGAMSGDVNKGIFVTTSSFDERAVRKAHDASHTIVLVDGDKLSELMIKFNVGIQIKATYEVKEIDEDFFEES